ncbi:hypothetical protein A3A66_03105 [Microgenomates group bacterium RIFCSPLOWO2_01_FULL_46_13]|nr:MAG: hypothetical protein A2783_04900 [Microgenomates group bacterium RIFCSPHIGHO2_01_FULL_45_11]OGV94142.1 MAG: hypothetical protein A3A66_03105 [Microgenomates group bacterium RIFCSPLOWO2_01_FULL_46_13]
MLRQTLQTQLTEALRAKDQVKLDTLRFIWSQIKNAEIDKHADLTDEEIVKLITKEVKNRKEAIDQFKTGNRQDLVDQETAKLKILEVYLPQQMSPQEIEPIVAKIIQSGLTEFGAVMAKVMAQTKGQAEGSLVATIVRKKLT